MLKNVENQNFKTNIFDYNGRLIKSVLNNPFIDIQSLSPGIYVVEIAKLGSDNSIIKKLVKR